MSMRSAHRSTTRGFGLLEVVISAGILATVLTASIGLMNQSLKQSVLASERMTGMYLATEGLEQVRMLRDTIHIDGMANDWDEWATDGAPVLCSQPQVAEVRSSCASYQVDLVRNVLVPGEETFALGGRTYTRTLYVAVPDAAYAQSVGLATTDLELIRKIVVRVAWGDGPAEQVESTTYLTNWRSGV